MQSEMGIGIIGDDQTQITPFQRQVFEAQKKLESEEKEKKVNQAQGGGGRQKNQMAGQNPTASRSETVRYNSEGEREDDVLEVI